MNFTGTAGRHLRQAGQAEGTRFNGAGRTDGRKRMVGGQEGIEVGKQGSENKKLLR